MTDEVAIYYISSPGDCEIRACGRDYRQTLEGCRSNYPQTVERLNRTTTEIVLDPGSGLQDSCLRAEAERYVIRLQLEQDFLLNMAWSPRVFDQFLDRLFLLSQMLSQPPNIWGLSRRLNLG